MKKIFTIIATVAVLSLTSCQKYLDINHNPNSPGEEQATIDMALPAAEMALSARYGDVFRIIGGYFSQQYAQYFGTSNYLGYSKFQIAANSTSGATDPSLRQGVQSMRYRQPASRAGTASISTVENSGALPPGM